MTGKLRKRNKKPSLKLKFFELLQKTWQEISQGDIRDLITSMARRLLAFFNARMMSTKN